MADQDTVVKNLQRRVEKLEQQLKVVAEHAGASEVLAALEDEAATGKKRGKENRANEDWYNWDDL